MCEPFSVENLHKMAVDLRIGKHWYEISRMGRLPHYDIPDGRYVEIKAKCKLVSKFEIVRIIKRGLNKK